VLLWSACMLAAEAYSRDLLRAFVGYDALLGDWRAEVARIERGHGARLPRLGKAAERNIDAALAPELRHNQAAGELAALSWAGRIAGAVYDWCAAAARYETPDRAVLETARRPGHAPAGDQPPGLADGARSRRRPQRAAQHAPAPRL
jgi:hypothetical protein